VDETGTGHQVTKSMTWRPKPSMRPSTVEKELNRQATLFEEKAKQGLTAFGGSTKFSDFAADWLENEPFAFKTRERYRDLLVRIDAAIGNIRLNKLQARHLEKFYKNLAEAGVNDRGNYVVSDKLGGILKKRKLSRASVAKAAGISAATVGAAARCGHISPPKGTAICRALNLPLDKVFAVRKAKRDFPTKRPCTTTVLSAPSWKRQSGSGLYLSTLRPNTPRPRASSAKKPGTSPTCKLASSSQNWSRNRTSA